MLIFKCNSTRKIKSERSFKMTEKEKEKMIEAEEEGLMLKRDPIKSDDIIEELMRKRTWKYTIFIMCLMVVWMGGPPSVYLTSFAGTICFIKA